MICRTETFTKSKAIILNRRPTRGPYQVDDRSDARAFIREFRGRGNPEVEWWQDNLDLEKYYTYQTISPAIHHYDTAFGKNFFYYNNPETGLWEIHPWDLDLTWADNMYGNENHEFNVKVAKNNDFNDYVNQANVDLNNRLNRDYQNSAREILDLLYNQEQTGMLIDEMAAFVYQPGEASFVDADRAMWDYNPVNAVNSKYTNSSKNASRWKYYQQARTDDYAGMIQILKDYVDKRNDFISDRILTNEEKYSCYTDGNLRRCRWISGQRFDLRNVRVCESDWCRIRWYGMADS